MRDEDDLRIGELRLADLELGLVPDVVLVAEGDELTLGGACCVQKLPPNPRLRGLERVLIGTSAECLSWNSATMSRVRSVEPSSAMTISNGFTDCLIRLSSCRAM